MVRSYAPLPLCRANHPGGESGQTWLAFLESDHKAQENTTPGTLPDTYLLSI